MRFSIFRHNPFARNEVWSLKIEIKIRLSAFLSYETIFDCVILFLCEFVYVCVWFIFCVYLYSVFISMSNVRATKIEVNFRFSLFGCVILFCEPNYVCVRFIVYFWLYSVCASTDVRALKIEIKLWSSMFGCVILLVYICIIVCVCCRKRLSEGLF